MNNIDEVVIFSLLMHVEYSLHFFMHCEASKARTWQLRHLYYQCHVPILTQESLKEVPRRSYTSRELWLNRTPRKINADHTFLQSKGITWNDVSISLKNVRRLLYEKPIWLTLYVQINSHIPLRRALLLHTASFLTAFIVSSLYHSIFPPDVIYETWRWFQARLWYF